jgi:hypothetical protein
MPITTSLNIKKAIITKTTYIIEDGVDFYSELNKLDSDISSSDNTCLITGKILERNSITLECNHSFNYISLFKELCRQKTFNINDPFPMRINEIKCPYCRRITQNILPFIPSIVNQLVKGVNSPSVYCMKFKSCNHVFRHGSHKGDTCCKNGFESVYGNICEKHYILKEASSKKLLEKQESSIPIHNDEAGIGEDSSSSTSSDAIDWTDEMQELYNSSNMNDIRKKLKEKNLPISGTKKIIIHRLFTHAASQ